MTERVFNRGQNAVQIRQRLKVQHIAPLLQIEFALAGMMKTPSAAPDAALSAAPFHVFCGHVRIEARLALLIRFRRVTVSKLDLAVIVFEFAGNAQRFLAVVRAREENAPPLSVFVPALELSVGLCCRSYAGHVQDSLSPRVHEKIGQSFEALPLCSGFDLRQFSAGHVDENALVAVFRARYRRAAHAGCFWFHALTLLFRYNKVKTYL
ncbi:MAG TPA: hypothetical protein VKX17_25680 [Planctomycetota bacterium]|nr:hypothetical protein [Planctomycetota bacterium]